MAVNVIADFGIYIHARFSQHFKYSIIHLVLRNSSILYYYNHAKNVILVLAAKFELLFKNRCQPADGLCLPNYVPTSYSVVYHQHIGSTKLFSSG